MSCKILRGVKADAMPIVEWRAPQHHAASGTARPGSGGGDFSEQESAARLARLQAESAAREAEARQSGYREGEAAAEQRLEGPLREAVAKALQTATEMAALGPRIRRQAEEDLVRLAVAIARRILGRELNTDPEALLGLVKAALNRLEIREVTRLRVNPAETGFVQQGLDGLALPRKLDVVPDAQLERGALVLETTRGSLDASVETQLQEIERGLTDMVSRRGYR